MAETPTVDGRDAERVLEDARGVVPDYTDEWDPDADDAGSALLTLFSSMAADVIERLDRVPEKHRIAFLDALGFGRMTPQPARLPVTFLVSDDAETNVAIPDGTRTVAPAQGGRPEQLFELPDGGGFEGTPANVEAVYSVDPGTDDVFGHRDALETGTGSQLFAGTDLQEHALNVGHAEVLNLKSGSEIWVVLGTNTGPDVFETDLVWEFYGEVETEDGKEESWHGIRDVSAVAGESGTETETGTGTVTVALAIPSTEPPESGGGEIAAETTDREVGGIESRWIRCRIPTDDELAEASDDGAARSPRDLFDVGIQSVTLSLVPPERRGPSDGDGDGDGDGGGDGDGRIRPDDLLSGDVPLEVPTEGSDAVELYPFGETWPLRNTFYVDSEEAFTKSGVTVDLEFTPVGREPEDELVTFEDQLSNGRTVTVQAVFVPEDDQDLPDGGVVVVTRLDEEGPTELGRSDPLAPGTLHENLEIDLGRRLTEETHLTADLYPAGAPSGDPGAPYRPGESKTAKVVLFDGGDPRLSWEYWNGEGWARLEGLVDGTDRLRQSGTVSFTVPDDLEPTTASGHEGHWIRARLVNGEYLRLAYDEEDLRDNTVSTRVLGVSPHFGGVHLSYGKPGTDDTDDGDAPGGAGGGAGTSGSEGSLPNTARKPDHLVTYNNLDYSADLTGRLEADPPEVLRPFHGLPDEKGTLYLGFDAELRDGPINLLFSVADEEYPEGFYPRVRWEYRADPANEEWVPVETEDGTESLTRRGVVSLVFPEPTVRTGRFGADLHWVRARIDGREFELLPAADDPTADPATLPVVVERIDVHERRVLLVNTSDERVDLEGYYLEFECAPADDRVRTFGGDAAIGPHGALVVRGESGSEAEDDDAPGAPSDRFTLEPPSVEGSPIGTSLPGGRLRDDTARVRERRFAGLQPRGIGRARPGLRPAEPPGEVVFGTLPLDERVRNAVTLRTPAGEAVTRRVEGEPDPCERWLETVPPAGEPDTTPPVVLGLYPNTGWAYNVVTVDGERLGASDGTPDQSFAVSSPPVTDETVWVNELPVLSEAERSELREADPEGVEAVTGPGDDPVAFWVRWTRVDDFLGSDADDRHYRLDPIAGRITFGNGTRGRIPPRATDSVRVDYRTGGGAAGNVRSGAVTELVSSIPFVDSVTNPEPGDAGADAESVEAVVARAPKELRDRGKAVSREDFERIAMAASRKLARVRCIPSMDDAGEYSPGWVTLLIVPNDARDKPVPSVELKHRVSEAVSEHAPATLVSHGEAPTGTDPVPAPELVVRGPSYVEVSVETTVRAGDVGSVSALESLVAREVDAFLHPLTGGETGEGWGFGELPCPSDLYALLEGIDGVDHVVDLSMTFRGGDEAETVGEGEETPNVAADVLAFGGDHAIEIDGTAGVTATGRNQWD